MSAARIILLLVPALAGCASSFDLPVDPDRLESAFESGGTPGQSGKSFEQGFLGGTLLDRGLFLGGLPFEALRFANQMENRIVHEGYAEREAILNDIDGQKEAERIRIDRKLQHPDPVIRQSGLSEVSSPESHYHRIVNLLEDPDQDVRYMAMRAMDHYWNPVSFPQLATRLFEDEKMFNREEAARQMPQFDPDLAVPTLLRALSTEAVGNVKRRVVVALKHFDEDRRVVPALIATLEDPEAIVRDEAHEALREITGQDFGFDPYGDPQERAAAAGRWREWRQSVPR